MTDVNVPGQRDDSPAEADELERYRNEFGNSGSRPPQDVSYAKDSRAAKAYEVALDIRKFEIDLYWKRAGYFWLLVAALTTSLGIVLTAGSERLLPAEQREPIALFISCSATVLACCWAVVNHASKAWQRNWEHQVDVLEDRVLGPLYKTVLFRSENARDLPVAYSISSANLWISIYICLIFGVSATYFSGIFRYPNFDSTRLFIVLGNCAFLALFWTRVRNFRRRADLWLPLSYYRRQLRAGRRVDAG
jgi:hypothetical protein